ncbi:MAG: ankyrin repeat domain-containing protein, partial [Verrucomicrobiota bacterium]|nr:ankyrin repeat domain-containing protein [Verrucomicrobiota bacterium]
RDNGGKHGTIHGAVASGSIEVVKEFLAAGVDVNSKNDRGRATPLRIAASRGYKEIVELLIEKGADLNPVTVRTTPLDMASDPEIITILRKNGGKTGAELEAAGK